MDLLITILSSGRHRVRWTCTSRPYWVARRLEHKVAVFHRVRPAPVAAGGRPGSVEYVISAFAGRLRQAAG